MTQNDIKISVVTVTYNSEKTIERTLKSVLAQGFTKVEHIIVDGKSSDSTLSIVDSYKALYEEKGLEQKNQLAEKGTLRVVKVGWTFFDHFVKQAVVNAVNVG